jgi:hypothetical protein
MRVRKNDSRQPRDLLKNRHSDSLKRVNFLFLNNVVDDEKRTSASQNSATATLCTEEFFLRTPFSREMWGGGQEIHSQQHI